MHGRACRYENTNYSAFTVEHRYCNAGSRQLHPFGFSGALERSNSMRHVEAVESAYCKDVQDRPGAEAALMRTVHPVPMLVAREGKLRLR